MGSLLFFYQWECSCGDGGQRSSPAVSVLLFLMKRSNITREFQLPPLWFFGFCFTEISYLTDLLDVLSEYTVSLRIKPLSVRSDLFSLFCFFSSSYYRSLTVLHLLSFTPSWCRHPSSSSSSVLSV